MKKTSEHIASILKSLPKTPGVYQMKNKKGVVIYVWKAKNLHSRVNSYFRATGTLTVAKKNMVAQIADIEILLCQTEVEALTLETNLIKHLSPKYNILMKDDKDLSYIKITNSVVPEVIRTRQKINDGGQYFGPFTQGTAIGETVRNLKKIFKIRNCKMRFVKNTDKICITDMAGRGIPCLDYYIGICPAPCLLKPENLSKHSQNIENLQKFLTGNRHSVLEDLENKKQIFIKNWDFENAKKIQEEISAIERLGAKQIVRDAISGDHDICILYEKYEQLFIGFAKVRSGQVVAVLRFLVEKTDETRRTVLANFLARQYVGEDDLPTDILLEEDFSDGSLRAFLAEKRVDIVFPKIWPKRELLDFVKTQTREYAYKRQLENISTILLGRSSMENVLTKLGFPFAKKWPLFFECYDISHTNGHFTYASRVLIKNGKPETSLYKKYKIKSLADGMIDDFASHKEVAYRRTLEGLRENNFPDLIIIDGGKGQLSSVIEGMFQAKEQFVRESENVWNFEKNDKFSENLSKKDEKIWWKNFVKNHFSEEIFQWLQNANFVEFSQNLSKIGIHVCSIAKREEEVFLPNEKIPILLEKWTPELRVIQKARDESHRFSITANRSMRDKTMKKNILEELPGIWVKTRKKLLQMAGNVDNIRNLERTKIEKILTKRQLETLIDHGIYE